MQDYHTLKNLLLLSGALCLLGLPACSWVKDWPPQEGQIRHNRAAAPTTPQARLMQTADATWLEPATQPEIPVPHMVPAHGEQASTINRVRELEAEIAQLRSDMSMMLPAMTKMAETQSAMRETLNAVVVPPATASQATSPHAIAPQAGAATAPMPLLASPAPGPEIIPAAQAAGPGINGIRFGEQGGKTRIVLDSQITPIFRYDMDEARTMLFIHLPGIGWQTTAQEQDIVSHLIAGYNASPDGAGGTNLAIQLRRPAQISFAQALPAAGDKGDRVVIDLNPL